MLNKKRLTSSKIKSKKMSVFNKISQIKEIKKQQKIKNEEEETPDKYFESIKNELKIK